MRNRKDIYHNHKSALSRLLKEVGLETMSNDKEIVDRIFNLLTENLNVSKIEGLISTSEIVKYGADISDKKTKLIYNEIVAWWGDNSIKKNG